MDPNQRLIVFHSRVHSNNSFEKLYTSPTIIIHEIREGYIMLAYAYLDSRISYRERQFRV